GQLAHALDVGVVDVRGDAAPQAGERVAHLEVDPGGARLGDEVALGPLDGGSAASPGGGLLVLELDEPGARGRGDELAGELGGVARDAEAELGRRAEERTAVGGVGDGGGSGEREDERGGGAQAQTGAGATARSAWWMDRWCHENPPRGDRQRRRRCGPPHWTVMESADNARTVKTGARLRHVLSVCLIRAVLTFAPSPSRRSPCMMTLAVLHVPPHVRPAPATATTPRSSRSRKPSSGSLCFLKSPVWSGAAWSWSMTLSHPAASVGSPAAGVCVATWASNSGRLASSR